MILMILNNISNIFDSETQSSSCYFACSALTLEFKI